MAALIKTVNKLFKTRTPAWADREEREQYHRDMDAIRTELYTSFM